MTALLAFWSHALAACLFGALLIWQLREGVGATVQRLLLGGLLLTLLWAWLTAIAPLSVIAAHAESARNLLWVGLLYSLSAGSRGDDRQLQGVGSVYAAVSAVLALQFVTDQLAAGASGATATALATTAMLLRGTAAAGALVLVHNLYGQAAPASRSSIRLVMLALAWLWLYDLNLYTLAYWQGGVAGTLYEGRGAAVALAAPLFALGGQQIDGWRLKLSRAATFQSLGLVALCSYFGLMAVLATALRGTDWSWLKSAALLLLAGMTVAAVVLLPSARLRGWFKVTAAKHLFEHRYDYRAEWLRVADTLGRSGPDAPPLTERVIRALADMVDAPAGLLLARDHGGIGWQGSWRWSGRLPEAGDGPVLEALWSALGETGRVVELDPTGAARGSARDRAVPLPPEWLGDERLWTGVPLLHGERLVGLVLLATPEVRRPLDWEDFDVLRTAARQAASTLAEAHGQQALTTARAFEDFNRRFAFILHDVKNLVSQLSLLTRNAERHADNPEFRADMIATLKSSAGKMNDLLARLAPAPSAAAREGAVTFALRPVLAAAVAGKRAAHEVRLLGPTALRVRGDPGGLEQAIAHLLQNAVDASPAHEPVTVHVAEAGERVRIEVIDRGAGMDPEFVRQRLFQPFASTKPGGFGIGAYEARSLIEGMGGSLAVDSRVGGGTRFTIDLTAAPHRESVPA
ncbi:PEP-CTERM system histidine kinase PrsK [Sphingomonas sp. BN140010]|uniref:histidine kinase n=1 Tax=Sphingomonas arvum TaxID=2992113 RepID=A0ABT3JCB2_9SPHN|nr:XrtA/PEP-CTERM system histidine kinase PrsK [Sphingomonas sp. BN140010]MCW3796712.1 PEP-CTERM system histidine kinase PrsK [Sphingomonas sp. BN140010]